MEERRMGNYSNSNWIRLRTLDDEYPKLNNVLELEKFRGVHSRIVRSHPMTKESIDSIYKTKKEYPMNEDSRFFDNLLIRMKNHVNPTVHSKYVFVPNEKLTSLNEEAETIMKRFKEDIQEGEFKYKNK